MANKEEDKKKEDYFKDLNFWIYFGIGLISILLLILFILIIYSLFTSSSSPVVPVPIAPVPIVPVPIVPKQNSIFSFISRSPSPPVSSSSPPVSSPSPTVPSPSPSPPVSSPSPSVSSPSPSPSVSSDKTKSTSFFQSLITPLYNRKINIPSSTTIKKGGSSRIFF